MEDRTGFMWFGTKDGLNRFDGYKFKVFRHDPELRGTIGHNFIQSLSEAQDKSIWVGTLNGLYRFDPLTERFSLIKTTNGGIIRDVKTGKNGNIWYIRNGMLCEYIFAEQRVRTFDGPLSSLCSAIDVDSDGAVWVSTESGLLHRFDAGLGRIETLNVFNRSRQAISNRIECILDGGQGMMLVGTSNQGFKILNTQTGSYKDISIQSFDNTPIYVRDFLHYQGDEFWIATESGIFIYNLKSGSYINLRHRFNDPYSLSDNAVYTLTRDREGGIWAGTYFGGINYFPKQYTPFEKFFAQEDGRALSGNAVREICTDDFGNIWIGTEDAGLNKFNPETGTFQHYGPTGRSTSLSHSNIHGLLAVGGELWIGTFEHGLDVMDIRSSKITRSYRRGNGPGSLGSNFVESLLRTSSGEILIGTASGLYRYNRGHDNFSLIDALPEHLHYTALMEDSKGNIWAGTLRDGLYVFNPSTGRAAAFKHQPERNNTLASNYVNGLFQDSSGTIWITTETGLCRLNHDQKTFKNYNSSDGFPSDVFYRVLEDRRGSLWISTARGLVRFDLKTESTHVYNRSNGILSDQFNYSSAFQDGQGRMYFGSVKGLIRFDPNRFAVNRHHAPLFITGFQVHNKDLQIDANNSALKTSINFTDEISLNYNQSTFSIDFAALSFTAPEITQYEYMLDGLEKSWTHLNENRKVYFTQLPAGSYLFKLRAANSSGIWSEGIKTLRITIRPPFWASSWAFLVYFVLAGTAIYYGFRYYNHWMKERHTRRIERWETQKDKELYQAKINFFTYVTHEIRTPLTLIKGPLDDISKKISGIDGVEEDILVMKRNTDRLIELTNQLLDFRKTEIKGFSLNFIYCSISKILLENIDRFKVAAEDRKLLVAIDIPKQEVYAFADPEALNKILSNLLDNACKYAAQTLEITLSVNSEEFIIEVSSDGKIIDALHREKIFEPFYRINTSKELRGTGIGLPLARSLAELHEGSLSLAATDRILNRFILRLPLHHAQEFNLTQRPGKTLAQENADDDTERAVNLPVVLLVEDNLEIRRFIGSRLVHEYELIYAGNGKEALAMLATRAVQLIVSDIMMPEMDGIELCKLLKGNIESAHIPIILLTARNTLGSKIQGLEAGADAYIEKPFSPDHLLTQINNLLVTRDKIKNYFSRSPLVHIKTMAYNKADEAFLEKLNECIIKNIDNSMLDVDFLANVMNMSRPTLYRKIREISDLTPHELISITRLKKAAELLAEGQHKILKIASMTGFSSAAQFSRSFAKQFGSTPSEFAALAKRG
nr:two-component regulator propeller domain-containing protein [Pedobacter sp. ELA7]